MTNGYLTMAGNVEGNDLRALVAMVEGMRDSIEPTPENAPAQPLLMAAGSEDGIKDSAVRLAAAAPDAGSSRSRGGTTSTLPLPGRSVRRRSRSCGADRGGRGRHGASRRPVRRALTGTRRSSLPEVPRRTVPAMDYRLLGNSGTSVSTLTLGTMTFGSEADEPTSHQMLDTFVAAGGTLVDTADVYSGNESERIIGRWLKSHPTEAQQVVLATKGRFPQGDGPNDVGLSRRHLSRALDASLERLGVETIDLYQMHAWDALTPIEETLRFLDDAVSAGKIVSYGFSNYLGYQITKAVYEAKGHGWAPPVTLQPQYNLLVRDIEHEVVPACLDAGIGLLPWSPLAGGWLSGSTSATRPPPAPPVSARTRSAAWRRGRPATATSGPGRCSTRCPPSPTRTGRRSPRSRSPGSSRSPQ